MPHTFVPQLPLTLSLPKNATQRFSHPTWHCTDVHLVPDIDRPRFPNLWLTGTEALRKYYRTTLLPTTIDRSHQRLVRRGIAGQKEGRVRLRFQSAMWLVQVD